MKIKNLLLTVLICGVMGVLFMSFNNSKPFASQYIHVNILESTIPGGGGRSKIIVTDASGATKENIDIKNYYSLLGLNFKNIMKNDGNVAKILNKYAGEGYEVVSSSSSTVGNEKLAVFVTKIIMKK